MLTNEVNLPCHLFCSEHWDREHLVRCTKVSSVIVLEMQWKCQWLSRYVRNVVLCLGTQC